MDAQRQRRPARRNSSARAICCSRSPNPTWQCGDPGMQYDTTINRWHTCKNTARINASNPCSEYMFLDDTACNLASLNLMKFVGSERAVRRGGVPPRRGHHDHGAGNPGGQRQLSDAEELRKIRTSSARSAWATRIWARC